MYNHQIKWKETEHLLATKVYIHFLGQYIAVHASNKQTDMNACYLSWLSSQKLSIFNTPPLFLVLKNNSNLKLSKEIKYFYDITINADINLLYTQY